METERFSLRDLPKLLAVFLGVLLGLYESQQKMTKNHAEFKIERIEDREKTDAKNRELVLQMVETIVNGSSPAAPQLPQDDDQPKADEIGGEP